MRYEKKASDKVFKFIINKIEKKEWLPNTQIWTEAELCKELEVSRVSVRQAIEKLSVMSLLKKKQGSGTYVASFEISQLLNIPIIDIDENDLIHILNFRRYFEYGNIIMFMENMTAVEIKELEKNYEEMANNINDMEKFYKEDNRFHNLIAKGTKNPFIIKMSELLMDILEKHQKNLYTVLGPEIGIEFHKNILKYIKEKDVQMASLYMQRHIDVTIKDYKNVISKKV